MAQSGHHYRAEPSIQSQWVAALLQRLREHGWIDGRTVKIIYRWAEGRPERFAEIATEFVNSNVDVIVTGGNAVSAVSPFNADGGRRR